MDSFNFEIEFKFLIEYPPIEYLKTNFPFSEITQIYLNSITDGVSERIRRRVYDDHVELTHTIKRRISDLIREEYESVITENEFSELSKRADIKRSTVHKTRYIVAYENHVFEIDVYPFWHDRAIMEVELDDENESFVLPDFIKVIRDVTSDRRYTNKSLAKQIVSEDIKKTVY